MAIYMYVLFTYVSSFSLVFLSPFYFFFFLTLYILFSVALFLSLSPLLVNHIVPNPRQITLQSLNKKNMNIIHQKHKAKMDFDTKQQNDTLLFIVNLKNNDTLSFYKIKSIKHDYKFFPSLYTCPLALLLLSSKGKIFFSTLLNLGMSRVQHNKPQQWKPQFLIYYFIELKSILKVNHMYFKHVDMKIQSRYFIHSLKTYSISIMFQYVCLVLRLKE